jgi:putative transposase
MSLESDTHSELPFPKLQKGKTTLEFRGRVHAIVGLTKGKQRLLVQDEETGEPDTLSSEQFWQL